MEVTQGTSTPTLCDLEDHGALPDGLFSELPPQVQEQAREAYRLFRANPNHPSLRFRRVHPTEPIYSARITLRHRALGVQEGDVVIWFWIGSHAKYDDLISRP